MENQSKHKHYDLAYRAYGNISFRPEKRAESECAYFDSTMRELREIGCSEKGLAKFESLFVKYLGAKSRCISSMITGPANFPVRRAEKANNAEHNASVEMTAYVERVRVAIKKENYYKQHPEARPIMAGDSDAAERLQRKLDAAKKYHAQLKEVKSLIRKGMGNAEASAKAGLSSPVSWHSFNIQYANKAVKEIEAKIASLQAAKEKPNTESIINGVRVLQNTEAMRLQLFFDGKPPAEMISKLKRHGFRWSPRNMAWQRQLTGNALYSLSLIFEEK